MDMGRPALIAVIVAIALVAFAGFAGLRECGARRSAEQVFNEWMSRNCAVGEGGVLERELQRNASRLEPRLEQAFLEGPPPALRAQQLQIAQRERDEVVAAIDAGKTHGLNQDEISRLRTSSARRASDPDLDDYVEGYRSAALAGLGVIGTARARDFLQRIQREPSHRAYWGAAELNLKRSTQPQR
jgi:hypothetical protein